MRKRAKSCEYCLVRGFGTDKGPDNKRKVAALFGLRHVADVRAFVLISANIIISLLRGLLKPHLRILVFTMTIATFVTIADRFLAAYMYQMSKQLGPYVPLIIVNCLIISRCEICSSKQGLGVAIFDGVGMSLGFALALASIATVREILGSGGWFGLPVMPESWPNWGVMLLPPGAFLTLGLLLGFAEWISHKHAKRRSRKNRTPAHGNPCHPHSNCHRRGADQ